MPCARFLFLVLSATLLAGCSLSIDSTDVFRPQAVPGDRAPLALLGEAELSAETGATFRHEVLELGGQRIAVTEARRPGASAVFLHCGGNASDRPSEGAFYARKLLPLGDALLWDYPGYGDSAGTPDAASIEAAGGDLLQWAERRAAGRPLILWGHSLGGFVCAQLASRSDAVDAVVLEATARNVDEVAKAWKPWWLPARIRPDASLRTFDTATALKNFPGPVVIIGAERDGVLPVELHRSLADALPEAEYVEVADGNHYTAGPSPEARAAVERMLNGL